MPMFLVVTRYTRSIAEVDSFRDQHLAWIEQLYTDGHMLISGRQSSGDGGVLVMQSPDEEQASALLAEDPFHREELIETDLIPFVPTPAAFRGAGFAAFVETLSQPDLSVQLGYTPTRRQSVLRIPSK